MHRVWTGALWTISFAAVVLAGSNMAKSSTARSGLDVPATQRPASDAPARVATPPLVTPATSGGLDPAELRRLIREELANERASSCASAGNSQPARQASIPSPVGR